MIGTRFTRGAAVAVAVLLPIGLVATANPASAATAKPTTATVTLLHAIPGVTVDVYANDKLLINDFTPGAQATVKVPGATYNLEIFPANAPDSTGTPILQANATVANGKNYTGAAYLTAPFGADGKLTAAPAPTLALWANNIAAFPKPKNSKSALGRVTVRHLAVAPPVSVYVNGTEVNAGAPLVNGAQIEAKLPKGVYQAAAGLAGAGSAAIALGPVPLPVRQGWNTIVYAWGLPAGTKDLAGNVSTGYQVAVQFVKLNLPKK